MTNRFKPLFLCYVFFQLDIKRHSSSCFSFTLFGDNLPKAFCFAVITV